MLSIGKLAFLATVEFDELSNEEIHDTVEEGELLYSMELNF